MAMQLADNQGFPAPQNPHAPPQQSPTKTYKYQSSSPFKLTMGEDYYMESQGIEKTYSETMPTPPASVAGSIARSIKSHRTNRSNNSNDLRMVVHGVQQQQRQLQQQQREQYQEQQLVVHKKQQQQLVQYQQPVHKVVSQEEQAEKQERGRKIFWCCFGTQVLVILILIIVWASNPSSLVEKTVARAEGTASGAAKTLIGINDTFRIDTWDEYMGLSDDDYFGDGTLCPDGVDTPIAVLTDKPCYARPDSAEGTYSEPIAVVFENCSPQFDDWIGIYDADHNIFQPGIHRVDYWSWACGDQQCQKPVRGGIIVFAGIQQYGDFKVHLHRREGDAEEMYLASSETFTVQQSCDT